VTIGGNNTQFYNNQIYAINANLTYPSSNCTALTNYSGTGNQFLNNTIANNNARGIQNVSGQTSGGVVANTISYGNAGGDAIADGSNVTTVTNLIGIDPLFVNAAARNYQLSSTSSPAYNTGTTEPTVTTDAAGVTRPQCGAYDIGAFERVSCQ